MTTVRGPAVLQHCQAPLSCSRSRHAPSSQRCMQASRAALDEFSQQPRKPRRDLAGPAHVFAPATESRDATSSNSASSIDLELEERTTDGQPQALPSWPSPVSIADVTRPVAADRDIMNQNLMNIGDRHETLQAAAKQIFGAGGKKLRPVIVFLVGRATMQLTGLRCTSHSALLF